MTDEEISTGGNFPGHNFRARISHVFSFDRILWKLLKKIKHGIR